MTRRLITKSKSAGLYPTPAWATEALLKQERFTGHIWEPCAGDGAMANVLRSAGHYITATDILNPTHPNVGLMDAFDLRGPFDNVVTNPPFPLAEDMLRHFLPQT